MDGLFQLIGLVALIVLPIMFILGNAKKKEIGTVTCRRCGHEGLLKAEFRVGKGNVLMCSNCKSEDWVAKNAGTPNA